MTRPATHGPNARFSGDAGKKAGWRKDQLPETISMRPKSAEDVGPGLWVPIETASEITGIEISTLEAWAHEYAPHFSPARVSGSWRFSKADLQAACQIKRLIADAGFTSKGVHKALQWTSKRAA